jgi:hypothetical protein
MPIMSVNPEYLRDRAKAAEIAGDIETAEAIMQEAEDAAKALVIEAESATQPGDATPQ